MPEVIANGGERAGSAAGDGSGGTVNSVTNDLNGTGYITVSGGTFTLPEANINTLGGSGQYGVPAELAVFLSTGLGKKSHYAHKML